MNTLALVVTGLLNAIDVGFIIRFMMRRERLRAVSLDAEVKRVVAPDTLRAGWFSAAQCDPDSGRSDGGNRNSNGRGGL